MEPERPIEKLLRDWAKKRREETPADFDLHPANRRLLQGEITEQFGRETEPARSVRDWLKHIWPRIAIGAGAFAALGVLALVFWSGQQKNRSPAMFGESSPAALSRSEPQKSSLPTANPAPATPANSPTPEVALAYADREGRIASKDLASDSNSSAKLKLGIDRIGEQTAQITNSPPPATLAAVSGGRGSNAVAIAASDFSNRAASRIHFQGDYVVANASSSTPSQVERLSGSASQLVTPESANASSQAKSAEELKDSLAAADTGQQFYRFQPESLTRRKAESSAAQPILASFQLKQSANELQIVDADGSVYTGSIEPTNQVTEADSRLSNRYGLSPSASAPRSRTMPSAATPVATNQVYFFKVTGTNHTLNQNVIFTGTLLNAAGGDLQLGSTDSVARQKTALRMIQAGSNLPPSMRISGKAIVGGKNEIQVNAIVAP